MATKTGLNRYSETVLTAKRTIDLILEGKSIDGAIIDDKYERDLFNSNVEAILGTECQLQSETVGVDLAAYHSKNIRTWFMPDKYAQLDVRSYVTHLCNNQSELDRVNMEYGMYEERDLIDILRFFIYFVDHLREHKIVWGVGRGSSVASYILFLIGIHKIDSLKYDLNITEFLK